MRVWSVGHSTHTFEAFVPLLAMRDISLLADIRTVPKSRRHPQFHAEALARSLPARGVTYVELPRLGGWRRAAPDSPNEAWRNLPCAGLRWRAGSRGTVGELHPRPGADGLPAPSPRADAAATLDG